MGLGEELLQLFLQNITGTLDPCAAVIIKVAYNNKLRMDNDVYYRPSVGCALSMYRSKLSIIVGAYSL